MPNLTEDPNIHPLLRDAINAALRLPLATASRRDQPASEPVDDDEERPS